MTRHAEHVAIYMGGCDVWTQSQGLSAASGLGAAVLAASAAVETAVAAGVQQLTLVYPNPPPFPSDEIAAAGLEPFLKTQRDRFAALRVKVLGNLAGMPQPLLQGLRSLHHEAGHGPGMKLTLLWNYSGRADLLSVARELALETKSHGLPVEAITPKLIESRLASAHLAPVDLLICCGPAPVLPDALLFETAYAELCFPSRLWPDFSPGDLLAALAEFGARERRFGKTSAQVHSGLETNQ